MCRHLELSPEYEQAATAASALFPLFAPRAFVAKMQPGDPHDPLLRQVLPLGAELEQPAGFSRDPVGDGAARLGPGLLQKYRGRALLIATGACAVHCRYCFRRHFPYGEVPRGVDAWNDAVTLIEADPSIEEVILSGGDPLMLVDEMLQQLIARLEAVAHVRRLRIHTRLPIMIPERVTVDLVDLLRGHRLTTFMVVHSNHPNELGHDVVDGLARLADAGIPLLNQAVLLQGVNDDWSTLVSLSRRLIDSRVTPYYLHQMDRVAGAAHFEVPLARGMWLIEQMRERLPGYAVPRFVSEVAGESSKRILA